jgi:hypothetical protein
MAAKKAPAKQAPPPEAKKVETASYDTFRGEDVNVPDIDGWYSPEEGEPGWVGRIVGVFSITDDEGRKRSVVVVRLLSDCDQATLDGEPVALKAGHAMAVSMRARLMGLLDYVEKRATVAVKATGKRKLQGGRSMWLFEVKGAPGQRVRRQEASPAPSSAAPIDDIPW